MRLDPNGIYRIGPNQPLVGWFLLAVNLNEVLTDHCRQLSITDSIPGVTVAHPADRRPPPEFQG